MIPTHDIEEAAKQVDLEKENEKLTKAWQVALDKIEKMEKGEYVNSIKSELNLAVAANKKLHRENTSLGKSYARIKSENKRLTEELKAANRKLEFAEMWIDENEGGKEFKLYKLNAKDI